MKPTVAFALLGAVTLSLAGIASGEESSGLSVPEALAAVSAEEGLAAWDRIFAVNSHPRCANCHVDERNIPVWYGASGDPAQPHGMNINAGDSRIGAETLPCSICHVESKRANTVPHAAPHAGMEWRLAPVEFLWFAQSSEAICAQMSDPERNGDRDAEALIEHIVHDAEERGFITWAFNPGPGREPAPGSMQDHLNDMVVWTAAGMPCPKQ